MTRSCLFLMHSFGGGAESVALTLAGHLHARGHPIRIACTRHIPELHKAMPQHIPFLAPAGPSFRQWMQAMRAIRAAARASRIVLGTLELQSIFWAALFGKKTVGWLHKDLAGYFAHKPNCYVRLYASILGWAFSRCTAIACVSRGVRDSARALFPAHAAKLHVLYNPIDLAAIRARSLEALPADLAACFVKPVILGAGRLVPQKAFHTLVRAHALLCAQGSDHTLCILGDGPERRVLEREATRLGVRDSTFLPGCVNPYPAMRRAAVLGVSSVFEGFPTVIMEALALGLPVASTDCPHGPAEILADGTYGRLAPMNDPEALAQALCSMMYGHDRARYIRIGMERVNDFSLERAVAAWETCLHIPDP